jgi:hypothetical protein
VVSPANDLREWVGDDIDSPFRELFLHNIFITRDDCGHHREDWRYEFHNRKNAAHEPSRITFNAGAANFLLLHWIYRFQNPAVEVG